MATKYPAAFDSFTNPTGVTDLDTSAFWTHAQQHGDLNDAVEAIQLRLGIDGVVGGPEKARHTAEHVAMGMPYLLPNLPAILSSLVAGTMASRTSGVVTVDCGAAHNIPATIYDGFWVHYPGSTNIPSGWYPGFVRTGANTFTFVLAGANVTSESVNGGAANTFATAVTQITIPANVIGPNGRIFADLICGGDNTVTKTFLLTLNGSNCNAHVGTTFNVGEKRISIVPFGAGALSVRGAVNNGGDNSLTTVASWDRTAASTIGVKMAAGASAGFAVLFAGSQIEIRP